jgi:uroporphyrinogen decarboxylase
VNGAERLLAACRCEPVDATPVWFMRQAGGSLPRYRALRERHSVVEIARDPELCAEVTCDAAETLGVDGAVLFADIMLPLEPMGVDLELAASGPVIARPIRSAADVDGLRSVDVESDLGFVLEAIRRVRARLTGRAAVIGICGAPFTLAAYLIEGGPSRDQAVARAFMHREPGAWHLLMSRLADVGAAYVRAQADAGADVVQVFDSWAGSLSAADYEAFAAPYSRRVIAAAPEGTPVIHFATGSSHLLPALAAAGGHVLGVDWRIALGDAWRSAGGEGGRAVQGNLDPALTLAGWERTADGATAVLRDAEGLPGHVFNLGHAAPRDADPGVLRDLASLVHDVSARRMAGAALAPRAEATARA